MITNIKKNSKRQYKFRTQLSTYFSEVFSHFCATWTKERTSTTSSNENITEKKKYQCKVVYSETAEKTTGLNKMTIMI